MCLTLQEPAECGVLGSFSQKLTTTRGTRGDQQAKLWDPCASQPLKPGPPKPAWKKARHHGTQMGLPQVKAGSLLWRLASRQPKQGSQGSRLRGHTHPHPQSGKLGEVRLHTRPDFLGACADEQRGQRHGVQQSRTEYLRSARPREHKTASLPGQGERVPAIARTKGRDRQGHREAPAGVRGH